MKSCSFSVIFITPIEFTCSKTLFPHEHSVFNSQDPQHPPHSLLQLSHSLGQWLWKAFPHFKHNMTIESQKPGSALLKHIEQSFSFNASNISKVFWKGNLNSGQCCSKVANSAYLCICSSNSSCFKCCSLMWLMYWVNNWLINYLSLDKTKSENSKPHSRQVSVLSAHSGCILWVQNCQDSFLIGIANSLSIILLQHLHTF